MHFHLPKPLHGWRALAGEVGIIVVGVLIALAAEQVVENWQWQRKVAIVRQSLMGELGNDRARWERDVAAARCAQTDLERLDNWAKGGATAPVPPAPSLDSGNLLSMHSANWSLATGSQTLDHFPVREQIAFAALYNGLANRELDLGDASKEINRVHTLIPLAGDPRARMELREELGDLRGAIGDVMENVSYMTQHFDALDVRPDRSDFAETSPTAGCAA